MKGASDGARLAEPAAPQGAGERGLAARAEIEIRPSRPADDAARELFLEGCPRATFFHRAGWGRAVEQVFGHQGQDLLAWRGDAVVGVLPLMRTANPLGRANLVSMPYAVYGGPVAAEPAVEQRLVEVACDLAERERVGRLELRCLQAPPGTLRGSDLYVTFRQDLPEDPAKVLASMPKKARAEARKARERHGLELQQGIWYVEDLYRLFQRNKRSLGSPGLPMRWFRALRAEFGQAVVVHLVRRGSEPLAAVMSFLWKDTCYAYYSGTAPGADRSASASNFMYLALREWAAERGLARFDFGRSRRDSGAYHFKMHQGFEPEPLAYRYHLVRHTSPPSFTPSNPWTALPRRIWSQLPLWATQRLSDGLARYLP